MIEIFRILAVSKPFSFRVLLVAISLQTKESSKSWRNLSSTKMSAVVTRWRDISTLG